MFWFARLLRLALGDSFQAALNELKVRARTRASARAQDRVTLLWRLRARRRELVNDLAIGLGPDEPLPPSTVEPLAVLQAAIEAVEAELSPDDPDRPPAAP